MDELVLVAGFLLLLDALAPMLLLPIFIDDLAFDHAPHFARWLAQARQDSQAHILGRHAPHAPAP